MNALRKTWLNPLEWVRTEVLVFPGSVDGPWRRFIGPSPPRGEGRQVDAALGDKELLAALLALNLRQPNG